MTWATSSSSIRPCLNLYAPTYASTQKRWHATCSLAATFMYCRPKTAVSGSSGVTPDVLKERLSYLPWNIQQLLNLFSN